MHSLPPSWKKIILPPLLYLPHSWCLYTVTCSCHHNVRYTCYSLQCVVSPGRRGCLDFPFLFGRPSLFYVTYFLPFPFAPLLPVAPFSWEGGGNSHTLQQPAVAFLPAHPATLCILPCLLPHTFDFFTPACLEESHLCLHIQNSRLLFPATVHACGGLILSSRVVVPHVVLLPVSCHHGYTVPHLPLHTLPYFFCLLLLPIYY